MKRIAVKLLVFLLLGAMASVGVAQVVWSLVEQPAWSLAKKWDHVTQVVESDHGFWTRHAEPWPNGPGILPELWYEYREGSVRGHFVVRPKGVYWEWQMEAGWPVPCVAIDFWQGSQAVPADVDHNGWTIRDRQFPKVILWPGFLINSFCYGLILWVVWSAPFATRRLIRKQRGKCVRCGYDLRGTEHEVCPECGDQR